MAASHIALLRGINVGRAKRVAMADLRTLVAKLGYVEVQTLLNSGNVVFTIPRGTRGDPAARIEQAIARQLKVSCRVVVLTADTLAGIVRANPLGDIADDPSRLLVTVLAKAADGPRLRPLLSQTWTPEAFDLGAQDSYLWCPRGIIDSPLAKAVSKVMGDGATSRNWATIGKLHALATGED